MMGQVILMTVESYKVRSASKLNDEISKEAQQYRPARAALNRTIETAFEKKLGHLQKDMFLFQIDDAELDNPMFFGRPEWNTPHAYTSVGRSPLGTSGYDSSRQIRNMYVHKRMPTKREVRFSSLSKLHSFMWLFLVSLALIWGVITGASFFAGFGIGPSAAAAGFFATIALAVTMYFVGTRVNKEKREF